MRSTNFFLSRRFITTWKSIPHAKDLSKHHQLTEWKRNNEATMRVWNECCDPIMNICPINNQWIVKFDEVFNEKVKDELVQKFRKQGYSMDIQEIANFEYEIFETQIKLQIL